MASVSGNISILPSIGIPTIPGSSLGTTVINNSGNIVVIPSTAVTLDHRVIKNSICGWPIPESGDTSYYVYPFSQLRTIYLAPSTYKYINDCETYSNKVNFYKSSRTMLEKGKKIINCVEYNSGHINMNEENIEDVFLIKDSEDTKFKYDNCYDIGIKKNDNIIYSCKSKEYADLYGISPNKDNEPLVYVVSNKEKEYNTKAFINSNNEYPLESTSEETVILKNFNPTPYIHSLDGLDSKYPYNSYTGYSFYMPMSKIGFYSKSAEKLATHINGWFGEGFANLAFPINWTKATGTFSKKTLHTDKLVGSEITDNYAGQLGYTKTWAGHIIELYYELDSNNVGCIYTKITTHGSVPSSMETNEEKTLKLTNVPQMINIELQAGGGPGDSPTSFLKTRKFYITAKNKNHNIPLALYGGGSGAYGSFSLYMEPSSTTPQAVIYVGLGGLASDSRMLNGYINSSYSYQNKSRYYAHNVNITEKSMDGFSSIIVAKNVAYELEGGCSGLSYLSSKISESFDASDISAGRSFSADGRLLDTYSIPGMMASSISSVIPQREIGNNFGKINKRSPGVSSVLGYLTPNNLICGICDMPDYSSKSGVLSSFNAPAELRTVSISANTNNNAGANAIKSTVSYLDSDVSNIDISSKHFSQPYGYPGYYGVVNVIPSTYTAELSAYASGGKVGVVTGLGGAPSLFGSGGAGGYSTLLLAANGASGLVTYASTGLFDYDVTIELSNRGMQGSHGSGGGGGCGYLRKLSSSTTFASSTAWFDYYCVMGAPGMGNSGDEPATDFSLRGGDGGSGFFNIIF